MSDLFTDIMSASAASSAADAASASRAAAAASTERLESTGRNPFLVLHTSSFETVPTEGGGFFLSLFGVGAKKRLVLTGNSYSLKRTDIGYFTGGVDDFGNSYVKLYLEERCNLRSDNDIFELYVAGTLESFQSYINSL